MTRSSVLETLRQDYIRTAYAKGLRTCDGRGRHALKNGMIPIMTVIGIQIGYLLGGAVIIEVIFAMPGIGRYAIDSISYRDYPVLQGTVLFLTSSSSSSISSSMFCMPFLDPRIRYS